MGVSSAKLPILLPVREALSPLGGSGLADVEHRFGALPARIFTELVRFRANSKTA
jgi:hypothetical protein